jgi:hypothetical protein
MLLVLLLTFDDQGCRSPSPQSPCPRHSLDDQGLLSLWLTLSQAPAGFQVPEQQVRVQCIWGFSVPNPPCPPAAAQGPSASQLAHDCNRCPPWGLYPSHPTWVHLSSHEGPAAFLWHPHLTERQERQLAAGTYRNMTLSFPALVKRMVLGFMDTGPRWSLFPLSPPRGLLPCPLSVSVHPTCEVGGSSTPLHCLPTFLAFKMILFKMILLSCCQIKQRRAWILIPTG